MEMLELNDLHKTFNPGTVNEKVALNGVSLRMEAGDFATIVGSNGAGKSTLFNAITGGFIADEGSITLGGQDITFTPEFERSRVIGHLFQDPLKGTAPNMTIEENLALAYLRAGTAPHAIFSRISRKDKALFREKLALLDMGLEDRMKQPVGLLSGGQRQALTLLMATLVTPKLLLLDEHTAALDPATAEKVLELTQSIVAEKKITCLMVTHNMHQALELGNRTLMMDAGRVVFDVTDEERMLYFREEGYAKMVENMRQLCHDVRCDFDKWFSERTVYIKDTEGEHAGTSAVDRAFAKLDEMGYLYNKDGALWFRSTDLGDDKDRVLVKANGEYTYFASDVAYHWDKFQRVDHVIDIWGCDHHGYINRVRCVCDALGYPGQFEVLLGQFVNLLRNGKPIRMSKRKGTMVTFQELVDEVGADATRYTLISRSSNQAIDFDIEAVKEKSQNNPVYYVQYAHARICSVLKNAQESGIALPDAEKTDLSVLSGADERQLIKQIALLPEEIVQSAVSRDPSRLNKYAVALAQQFHHFYNACRIKDAEPAVRDARLTLCLAAKQTIENVLKLIGVDAPESM